MTKLGNVSANLSIKKTTVLDNSGFDSEQKNRAVQVVRGIRARFKKRLNKSYQPNTERTIALLTAPLTDHAANILMAQWSAQYWEVGNKNKQLMLTELVSTGKSLPIKAEQKQLFFRRLYASSNSLYPLVQIRADLLLWNKDNPELNELEKELKPLLVSWFDLGMLELKPITWNSPASLLEKLIEYEAVHEINSWSELKHRLTGNRRCYAYFHPRMPDIPLIFVEIALTEEMADNVQDLLNPSLLDTELHKARCANFYSISNTQSGLRGISFGNFLLKRVVEALSQDYPQIRSFVTLSPIPGFTRWLEKQHGDDLQEIINNKTERRLAQSDPDAGRKWVERMTKAAQEEKNETVQRIGLKLAADYLIRFHNGQLVDSVARFHMGNGARLERLNWAADTSSKGLKQSAGLMVNYLYDLEQLDTNLALLASNKPRSKLNSRWR